MATNATDPGAVPSGAGATLTVPATAQQQPAGGARAPMPGPPAGSP